MGIGRLAAGFAGRWLCVLALTLVASASRAQSVQLAGRMGDRALLVIDGQTRTLAIGASAGTVRLKGWSGDEADVEVNGQIQRLRIGGQPAQVGKAAPGPRSREIVLPMGPGGHFMAAGAINGKTVRFMVDSGATLVSLGRDEATRLGLDLSQARTGMSQTANGPVPVQIVVLNAVRVGDVEVFNVGAAVVAQPMPFLLLGNSFLSRFQMQQRNDEMRLQLR